MSTNTGSPLSLTLAAPGDIVDVTQHIANNFNAINNWATGITSVYQILAPIPSGNNCTAYNMGVSTMVLEPADMTNDPGWQVDPGAIRAEVITFKADGTRAIQLWFRGHIAVHAAYYRYMTNAGNYPWVKFGGRDFYGVNSTNTVIVPVNAWTRVAVQTGEVQAGVDIVPNDAGSPLISGLKLTKGGVYRVEATVQWDGGIGAGWRQVGIDLLTGAAPAALNRVQYSTSATEGMIQTVTFSRQFSAGVTIGMFCMHNNTGGLGVSTRRLYAERVFDSLI